MKTHAPSDSARSTSCGFVAKHQDHVIGLLEGFDRLRLRGTLRKLYCRSVMESYLFAQNVRFRDFGQFVQRTTQKVKVAAEGLAQRLGRPLVYVNSSATRKEDLAREIAERDGVKEGLIAVFKAVEPCRAYSLRRKREESGFEFRMEIRKCLHLYFYFEHPLFGFMHLRLQSWLPFQVDLCVNGRHWLGRQLDAAGLGYQKRGNAMVWVEDPVRAQGLLDEQIEIDWRRQLRECWH